MLSLPEYAITPNSIHCMDALQLCNALPDASVDMILCDLPYGTTALRWDSVIPFAPMWAGFKRVIKPRGAIVLTASQPFTSALVMSNVDWFRYEWIIEKALPTNFLDVSWRPLGKHEVALVFYKNTPTFNPQMMEGKPYSKSGLDKNGSYLNGAVLPIYKPNYGTRYPHTIIRSNNANQAEKQHPTQKPVALFEYLIKTYTQAGDMVFDPCVGSGTTAVAAHKTGRNYICGDFTPEYVAIARKRLQDADPYQATKIDDQHTQLSLFQEATA